MEELSIDTAKLTNAVVGLVSTWGLRVVGAIALLIAGLIVARWARAAVRKGLMGSKIDSTLIPFVTSLIYYTLVAFVVVAVLGLFGIPTASFIAVVGAAGLAIGLALQGTLGNFAAGVMLLVFRPFRVGDFVEVGGTAGTVAAVDVFSTTLNTPDNVQVTVPNGSVFGQTIKNYAANPTRRNDLVIGVSYGDDLGVALETIRKVLAADDRVLVDPAPVVAVAELGDSSVNHFVRPRCKREDYWLLRFDLVRKIKEELEKAGCTIPFPQRDVHMIASDADAEAAA